MPRAGEPDFYRRMSEFFAELTRWYVSVVVLFVVGMVAMAMLVLIFTL
jgi:hypothetical protein